MLTAFHLRNGRLEQLNFGDCYNLSPDVIWVDLVNPTPEERACVERAHQQELPDEDELEEIEITARFFEDKHGLHIHTYFLHDFDDLPRDVTLASTLKDDLLITLHDEDLAILRLFRMRARRQPGLVRDALDIMIGLLDTKIEQTADILEQIYANLETVSHSVHSENGGDMHELLTELAEQEDITGKARLSLLDTQRALSFLLRKAKLSSEQREQAREILRDVESLSPHTAFLFDKVNFLMDAARGRITIEQNRIIKIFSIAAVVFLPPTMIASIYGMNFHFMPELSWPWGYPFAITLMVLAGIAPYWYFKHRNWL